MPVKRIMIIDPSLYSRMILGDILRRYRYGVCYEASSCKDALAHYESVKPDLVLVEANMRDKDGVATIQALRHEFGQCRAVICASWGQRSQINAALSAGAIDFIAKPYTDRGVLKTLLRIPQPKGENQT